MLGSLSMNERMHSLVCKKREQSLQKNHLEKVIRTNLKEKSHQRKILLQEVIRTNLEEKNLQPKNPVQEVIRTTLKEKILPHLLGDMDQMACHHQQIVSFL